MSEWVVRSRSPVAGSPERTCTLMCMLEVPGEQQPGLDLDEVTDAQRSVEAHPTGVDGDVGRASGPPRRQHVGGLVDPAHDDAAVHLAAPVDVGGSGEEAQHGPRCGAGVAVGLGRHRGRDLDAQVDAALTALSCQLAVLARPRAR